MYRTITEVREELGLPINIILVKNVGQVKRPYSDAKMNILKKDHGVEGYLDEMFEAPDSTYSYVKMLLICSSSSSPPLFANIRFLCR